MPLAFARRLIQHPRVTRLFLVLGALLLASCDPAGPAEERPLRQLTPAEYNNSIRDLFGYGLVEDWPTDGPDGEPFHTAPWPWPFPAEAGVDGFEGYASAQVTSDLLAERQGEAAAHFAALVIDAPYFSTCGSWHEVDDPTACAWASIQRFAPRAWRRPLTEDEGARLRAFHDANVERWGAEGGTRLTVQGLLLAPAFLYLLESGTPTEGADLVPLTSWEVASRLSYLLTDSMPDPELFAAAEAGELLTPASVEEHARRLLAGRRAREAVVHFHRQWLELDRVYGNNASVTVYGPRYASELLESANPDILQEAEQFWSGFVVGTRRAMDQEAQAFVERVVFERGGSYADLLTDTFGYATEVGIFGRSAWDANTALLYGVDASDVVDGPFFVYEYEDLILPYELFLSPVELPADQRAGVMTLGATLAGRAHPVHPSPVQRGLFVLERLLCDSTGQPPPEALLAAEPDSEDLPGTNRGRLEALTSDPACAACHDRINPAGFAFEHYDSLGGWRTTDGGEPVDASGTFTSRGETFAFEDAVDLAGQLAASRTASDCYTRHWLRYALGRREVPEEADAVAAMQQAFVDGGGDVQELLVQLATSDLFRYRFVGGTP